jgi:hypothetical protein
MPLPLDARAALSGFGFGKTGLIPQQLRTAIIFPVESMK